VVVAEDFPTAVVHWQLYGTMRLRYCTVLRLERNVGVGNWVRQLSGSSMELVPREGQGANWGYGSLMCDLNYTVRPMSYGALGQGN